MGDAPKFLVSWEYDKKHLGFRGGDFSDKSI
jgi:hypothetical protein